MKVKTKLGREETEIDITAIKRIVDKRYQNGFGYEFFFEHPKFGKLKGVLPVGNWSIVRTLNGEDFSCFSVDVGWWQLDDWWKSDNNDFERITGYRNP